MSLNAWLRYNTTRDKMMSYMINIENQIGRSLIVPISYTTLMLMISHASPCIDSNINSVTDTYSTIFMAVSTILYVMRLHGGGIFRVAIMVYCVSFAPFFWMFLVHMFYNQVQIMADDPTLECRMMDIVAIAALIPTGYYTIVNIFLVGCLAIIGCAGISDMLSG